MKNIKHKIIIVLLLITILIVFIYTVNYANSNFFDVFMDVAKL